MADVYIPPEKDKSSFHCMHCGVLAHQFWGNMAYWVSSNGTTLENWRACQCTHCTKVSLWYGLTMIFPSGGTAPLPNPDLPEPVGRLYSEAREIVSRSPQGAAALLRLAVHLLTEELCRFFNDSPTGNLNNDIGILVRHGLPKGVQPALDSVRVIGNNAVHPGQIDLNDDPSTAASLFALINLIAEKTITEQKQIDAVYALLPASAKQQIEKRDRSPNELAAGKAQVAGSNPAERANSKTTPAS